MTAAHAMCPHCGWNFANDEPIELGDWRLTPASAEFKRKPIALTGQEAAMLHTLAKANGEPVSREALLNRISGSEDVGLVSVVAARLRAKLPAIPFEKKHGFGLRWCA